MRRPLKPFVTEYKASNRRNSGGLAEHTAFDSERAAPKPFDLTMRPEEDSYDAAMRAADALFSIPAPSLPKPVTRDPVMRDPVMRESGTHEAPAPDMPSLLGEDQPHEITTEPPQKTGGRILRVIDEAPSAEYAAREAEHAPKRRGRKPGSKNKPKVPILVAHTDAHDIESPTNYTPVWAAMPTISPTLRTGPAIVAKSVKTKPIKPKSKSTSPSLEAGNGAASSGLAATSVASSVAKVAAEPSEAKTAPVARNGTRFSWVRDKLKPGEDWKRRRLPKVCW